MTDAERLRAYVEAWHEACADTIALLRALGPEDWETPTDLPGWNVRFVAAHLAHLESDLAGNPQQPVEVPDAPHIKGVMGHYTEAGPVARSGWTTEEIVDELERSVGQRYDAFTADPPTDGSVPGPGFAALAGWTLGTLLSNRVVDVWMHQQDIRRATDRPGGFDQAAARHTADVFAGSLPYVLAKRAGAGPGTTMSLEVMGPLQRRLAAAVGDDGRGALLADPPEAPTVGITLHSEDWIVLAGGRRPPEQVTAKVHGDPDLAARVLHGLAVTV